MKPKYEIYVKPRLKEIEKWIRDGATDAEIVKALGIGTSSWAEYKKKYPEILDVYARARRKQVEIAEDALIRLVKGYDYIETKVVIKKGKTKDKDEITYTEQYKKHKPPSETAIAMFMRNYNPKWRDVDSTTADLRERMQKLKETMAESSTIFEAVFEDGNLDE